MIVVRDDCRDPRAILSPSEIKPGGVLCPAEAANQAAEAVLLGEYDLDQASFVFGVPAATIELWLRARRTAGLTPRMAASAG